MLCGADVCSPSGAICGSSGTCPLANASEYCYSGGKHQFCVCALSVCVWLAQGSSVLPLFCLSSFCRQTFVNLVVNGRCFCLLWHCQCYVHLYLQRMISPIALHCAYPAATKPCHWYQMSTPINKDSAGFVHYLNIHAWVCGSRF